ncbi:MAG: hypothetical protein IJA33_02260 [Oscillospiraceae bacterium]|nr:hypothetical protein [Oscillospiraceae bacterium]
MKKQRVVSVMSLILCTAMLFLLSACSASKGDTMESREALLNESIKEGKEWTIEKEITINNNIISAARGADDMTTLAIFRPTFEGGYAFSRSVILPSYLIMITSAEIGQENYDLFWVSDPKAVSLEISYIVDGEALEPLTYDVSNGEIIALQQEGKDISITACYYDSEGNRYTHGLGD